eukprot:9860880-Alexandrium_andersonii.AAC.1
MEGRGHAPLSGQACPAAGPHLLPAGPLQQLNCAPSRCDWRPRPRRWECTPATAAVASQRMQQAPA